MIMNKLKTFSRAALAAISITIPGFAAEGWEVGVSGGYGIYNDVTVTNASGQASTGFKSGPAFGVVAGNEMSRWLAGEARYTYRRNDMFVSSGSAEAQFKGESHIIHYDFLFHSAPRTARVRAFFAAGAGVKYYRGTGNERAVQPLSNFVALSKTSQIVPVISFGGGVKFQISPTLLFRVDVRDYTGPFPDEVIAPVPGAQLKGWLHDIVPTAGLSWVWGK